MKLHRGILEKLIDVPEGNGPELRHMLDDLGLEVKGIEGEGAKTVFNIETLANRGDHLSALGIAREISARNLSSIKLPAVVGDLPQKKTGVPISIKTPQCLRYALLEMTLPPNMKLRSDVASFVETDKHAIVDLSNYLLLEIGQPTHAFDRDKVEGEVIIDLTTGPEKVEALDGKTYELPKGSIVIKDKKKIIAVAGVIGCANSMVTDSTTRVLIESACFDPIHVRKTARGMGISTDASYVFERGSDVEMAIWALKRFAYLAQASGGAVKESEGAHLIGYGVVDGRPTEKRKVSLSLENIRTQLNLPRLPEIEITSRLKHLGYVLENGAEAGTFSVSVPSWRLWDVSNEADLVEDFARSHGLSRIKIELPPLDYETPTDSSLEALMLRIEPTLWGQGFFEVMTKSFYAADEIAMLEKLQRGVSVRHVSIKNALESSYSHLKFTNILHLARLAEANHRKGVPAVKVYEVGRLFVSEESKDREYQYERQILSMATSGRWNIHDWKKPEELRDQIFLFKGVLEGIAKALAHELVVGEGDHPFLHPGIQGTLKLGRSIYGYFGLIHPELKDALELKSDLLYAEWDMDKLFTLALDRKSEAPSEYPAVKRDITVKLEERSLASKVTRYVEEVSIPTLHRVEIADDFKKNDENFRRLTVRLVFQSRERTLEHTEVDAAMQQILEQLKSKHQIELA